MTTGADDMAAKKKPRKAEEIDLSPAEEDALDRAWARIAKQAAPKRPAKRPATRKKKSP